MRTLLFTLLLLSTGAAARADYYTPFEFHVQGSCENSRGLYFHQSSAWFRTDLGHDAHGRPLYADLTLQLFPNGKYWMYYDEVAVTHYLPDGGTEGVMVFEKKLEGTYAVHGLQLSVGGLFTAMPVEIHDQGGTAAGFAATFTNAIHNPRLMDREVIFGAMYSKLGPKGVSVPEYCHQ